MKKIEEIQEKLQEKNLDAILVTNPTNVYYLTHMSCDPHERLLMVVIQKNKVSMLVPAMEYENAKRSVDKSIEIVKYLDTEDGYMLLMNKVGKLKIVGIEKEHLVVDRLERRAKIFGIEECGRIEEDIKDMRKYKSSSELEKMRVAASLADKAISIAKENLKEGITELELKAIIEFEMKKYAKAMSFDTIVLFGKNAADPHGESGMTKLQKGDLALFDLGVYYEGYASDETRTLKFGQISEEAEKIYETVKRANMEAIKFAKPGVKFSEVDKVARDIIKEAGYGEYFTHRLGHGLGLDVHEYPDVSEKTDDKLEENMVFTIEPGIYVPGIAGVRIEDDVVVTKEGCEVLTKYEK